MDGLLESIARIDVEETGSELAALLLESQLIRGISRDTTSSCAPPSTTPTFGSTSPIPGRASRSPKRAKSDGAVYFGPFKNRRSVQIAIDLVNNHYPLRTCSRTFRNARSYGSPCIQLDLGKCLGPCVGRADRDEYMRYVRRNRRFLGGHNDVMLRSAPQRARSECRQPLDFERARKLRNSISLLQAIVDANVRLARADSRDAAIIVQPGVAFGSRTVMLVVRGRIWSSHASRSRNRQLKNSPPVSKRRGCATGPSAFRKSIITRWTTTIIVMRWLERAGDAACVLRLDSDGEIRWDEVAAHVLLELSDAMLDPAVSDPIARRHRHRPS